jgi:hypothetical protein
VEATVSKPRQPRREKLLASSPPVNRIRDAADHLFDVQSMVALAYDLMGDSAQSVELSVDGCNGLRILLALGKHRLSDVIESLEEEAEKKPRAPRRRAR